MTQSTQNVRYVKIQLRGKNTFLNMAEVQVFQGSTNLALGSTATQSSTNVQFDPCPTQPVAGLAVDGNTDGDFFECSVSLTLREDQPWWQVGLGSAEVIDRIVLWNRTDFGIETLSDFDVLVSGDGTNYISIYYRQSEAPRTLEIALGVRYVKVQLRGTNTFLNMAEMQVFQGSTNLALGGTATQSSTNVQFDPCPTQPEARLAVDGNTDGRFFAACSVSLTLSEDQPWWQVDLGSAQTIDRIVIWNRTDCCTTPLSDFDLSVWDEIEAFRLIHYEPDVVETSLTITSFTPNANLRSLRLLDPSTGSDFELSPSFSPTTTFYTSTVDRMFESVTVIATKADNTASVTINGEPANNHPSVNLSMGSNTITIVVTATDPHTEDTYRNTYTINVRRETSRDLASLSLGSVVTLSPAFSADRLSYAFIPAIGQTGVRVTAYPVDGTANVSMSTNFGPERVGRVFNSEGNAGISQVVGTNASTIDVTVTAQDGAPPKTYTITVSHRLSSEANLSNLILKGTSSAGADVGLSPSFTSNGITYTATVSSEVSTVYVDASRSDPTNASVTINSSRTHQRLVTLSAAGTSTTINVRVTAEDGTSTKTYTITVTRVQTTNTDLSMVEGSYRVGGTQTPAMTTETFPGQYRITVPSTVTGNIIITAVAQDHNAVLTIFGVSHRSFIHRSVPVTPTTYSLGVTNRGANASYQVTVSRGGTSASTAGGAVDPSLSADTTPPEVVATVTGTTGLNGWYNGDVDLAWSFSDPESPITDVTADCAPISFTVDTPPEGLTLTCAATSEGGTAETDVTIKRDATPPLVFATILEGSVPLHPSVWSNQDLTVRYTCTDDSSGLADGCGEDDIINAEGEHTVDSGQVCDLAGNCASTSITGRSDRTGPTLILPTGIGETTSGPGIMLTYDASATEPLSGVLRDVSCSRPSPSWFPVGVTTVTCTALDIANNIGTGSFTVTVDYVPPPRLNGLPGNITTAVESSAGAVVSYALPTASDGSTVTCTPASGSTFPLGTTQVDCTTPTGLSASFLVTVRDPDAPVLDNVPATIIAEAESGAGAAVTYTAPTAQDGSGASVPVTCTPASGSRFPLGTNSVVCEATAAGLTASTGFVVIVQDTTPPDLTGTPVNQTVEITSPTGAVVIYTPPTATDAVDGNVPVTCAPASGDTFPLGVTTVLCETRDAAGNLAVDSFTVLVQDSPPTGIGICGDVDQDGRVNILDGIYMLQFILGLGSPTADQQVLSDLDRDGEITVVDVIILLQGTVGSVELVGCGPQSV